MSNVRDFGAVGDGRTDDTRALQHALDDGEGAIRLPGGDYRITGSLLVDLARRGRTSLHGSGGVARLLMEGPGPALRLRGTHEGTADPGSFAPQSWDRERMPTVSNLEIEGRHRQADGIRLEGVMQPTLTGLLIRRVRTAVHVTGRARNLTLSHCHLYYNTGVGLHLDQVNLHQAIVSSSHISYCRQGGIRIEGSEIRNLQITGNDIEYNNSRSHPMAEQDEQPTADIYIDVRQGSVREGTIASNTIQATASAAGANVRFLGSDQTNHRAGMWTISGNLIGSQQTNIHLTSTRGISITGNYLYGGHHRNLLVERSRNIVVGSNCFGHNPDYRKHELATGIQFVDCQGCNLTGVLIEEAQDGAPGLPDAGQPGRRGLIELSGCRRMNLAATQVLEGSPAGIYLEDCSDTVINGCTVLDGRSPKRMQAAIRWTGPGSGNLISACRIGSGTRGDILAEDHVRLAENVLDEPS